MIDRAVGTPLVSVITPFLNGAKFMDEAVASVLDQTCPDWELLLVDDGSTDGSTETAKRYADLHSTRVRYLAHAGHANLGQSASRNLAIRHARGSYVAFLDVDDVWLSEKLENQIASLDPRPEAAMTYGPYFFWRGWTGRPEDLKQDRPVKVGSGREYDTVVPPPVMLLRHIEYGNGLPVPSSALVRRTALVAVGGFEAAFPGMYDDEALFAKLTLRYPVYITRHSWDRYRQHSDSFCARATRDGRWDPDPRAPSPDRVRFLEWLLRYVESSTPYNSELVTAIEKKLAGLRVPS